MLRTVIKRDGSPEWFDPEKLNKWAEWSAGLGVDWSTVVLEATKKLSDGCSTDDIHAALLAACIDQETTAHLKMAGRLYIGKLYKRAYGDWRTIPTVKEMYHSMVQKGLWAKMDYSDEELDQCQNFIDHSLDLAAPLTESKQTIDKYAISDRTTGVVYETPQFVYMRMALGNMEKMPKDRRMHDVMSLYVYLSQKKINPPSPFSLNLGTASKQYASCCTVTSLDSAASLAAADHVAYMMTCASAGIGAHLKTRSKGDAVRKGRIRHMGKIPYYKVQQAAVAANLQAGRGGALTMHYTVLDPEFWDLIKLKNVQTVAEQRVKDIDYSVGYNNEFARRVAADETWMLVSYGDAPYLHEAMYAADQTVFLREYAAVEMNVLIPKTIVKARDMAVAFLTEAVGTGRLYEHNTAELNRHTPFKDTIYLSNLCVAPETEILTSTGYQRISDLVDKEVDVWNGEEWSTTTVRKTGTGQKLLRVVTEDGFELDCTEYHKFYVKRSYWAEAEEVRAVDLMPGDKLVRLSTPTIQGVEVLSRAYENGFFSGDGCNVDGRARVYLYGDKRKLRDKFEDVDCETVQKDRTYFYVNGLQNKFFVPTARYTVDSRLRWLAGLLDADGHAAKNGASQTIQLTSVERGFLVSVQRMLQELGVQSKISKTCDSGMQPMPDGRGGAKEYQCKAAFRLLIGATGLAKLLELGMHTHRLSFTDHRPNRNAERFVRISEVQDNGRIDDTYCFNEPKRHMGVFNGLLTGQCQEIGLPVSGFPSVSDLYSEDSALSGRGEIGLCSLAAIAAGLVGDDEYEDVAYYAALMIDNVIDLMEYPFPHLAVTARARRSIGVGITNLAYAMAKNGLKYSSLEGKQYIARLAERHSYWLHRAGLRLALERGPCEWAWKTRYPRGWLPIDTANKEIQRRIGQPLLCDWEGLRKDIMAAGGLRFSVLEAHMPCESSSVAGGHTNGLYPIREYKVIKTSGVNKTLFICPEYDSLMGAYEMAWDVPAIDMIEVYAIVQCFTGQAISADIYIKYGSGDRKLSAKTLLTEWLERVKLGMKTRYYINSATGVVEEKAQEQEVATCDSCSL